MPSQPKFAFAPSSVPSGPLAPAGQLTRARRFLLLAALVAAGLQAQGFSLPAGAAQARPQPAYTGGFIVRWKDGTETGTQNGVQNGAQTGMRIGAETRTAAGTSDGATIRMRQVRDATGVTLSVKRQMGGNLQLLTVPAADAADPEATATRLRQDPRVAEVVPDRWLQLHDTIPNDPDYLAGQTYLGSATQVAGAANLPAAWDRTQGNASLVIAVVDTGYLPHPDLAPRLVAGYDFISDPDISLDGGGRDSDPTDAGDNIPANFVCKGTGTVAPPADNSWHGMRVASVIGAQTNNGTNIAGVDWQARIQPVRVAGRCGALLSDTVDGMRWAGGLSVPGVPDNPTPAHVINISLGGGSCSSAEQNAVNDLNARGVVVVAAAGNNAGAVEAPADCAGVITVTAHVNDGEKASYANFGPAVAISAPGGGCGTSKWNGTSCSSTTSAILTLSNRGATSPGTYFTLPSAGTSFATPTVAGVAALMLAVNGSLAPSQVAGIIKSTARPHPANTFCALAPNTGNCGAGMLDAAGALTLAANTQGTGTAWPTTPATPAAPAATDSGGGGAMPLWSGALLALLGLIGYTLPRRRSHA